MGLLDFLKLKKQRVKKVSTRQKTVRRRVKKKVQSGVEEPIMTISRQLTELKHAVENTNALLGSGFQGLREDHHRILEEQEKGLEEYRGLFEKRKHALQKVKEDAGEELALLSVDNKILELLEKNDMMRSISVANELKIARQYASQRLNDLQQRGFIKKVSRGRKIFYKSSK